MSKTKQLYWDEIEAMDSEDTPDLDNLKEMTPPKAGSKVILMVDGKIIEGK